MDFDKICMMFTMQEPYYGIILSSMNRRPTSSVDTMAVARTGNVFQLLYNQTFIDSLDIPTILELIKHEVLHLAFNHFNIWDTKCTSEPERNLRNAAADLEVNCYIKKENVHGVDILFPEMYNFDRELGTREYYKLLSNLIDQAQQMQRQSAGPNVSKPCNGGGGGIGNQSQSSDNSEQDEENDSENFEQEEKENNTGNPNNNNSSGNEETEVEKEMKKHQFDAHNQWPEGEESEVSAQAIEDMLVAAADEVEKSRGEIPNELKSRVANIRNKRKPKPVADWKRYVRRYLGNEFTEHIRKSKKRESRRFPDAAGNRHRRKSNILVAIDTSGSVSIPEYVEFFGQIRTLTATTNFDVVECDAAIQNFYHFRNKPNMTFHGGGGTSFEPVIDFFLENMKKYDALIYFTDGECPVPKNTPKETLWVISSKGNRSRKRDFQVNGSKVVFIPKHND